MTPGELLNAEVSMAILSASRPFKLMLQKESFLQQHQVISERQLASAFSRVVQVYGMGKLRQDGINLAIFISGHTSNIASGYMRILICTPEFFSIDAHTWLQINDSHNQVLNFIGIKATVRRCKKALTLSHQA